MTERIVMEADNVNTNFEMYKEMETSLVSTLFTVTTFIAK